MELKVNGKFVTSSKMNVLLCSKMTSFPPSEGEFSEKCGIFSKVKNFPNPFSHILKIINKKSSQKMIFGYHDALKNDGAPKLCTIM